MTAQPSAADIDALERAISAQRWNDALAVIGSNEAAFPPSLVARVFSETDQLERAIRILETQQPDERDWYLLGDYRYRAGLFEAAADAFRAVTEASPDDYQGWWALASCFSELGDRDKAIEYYREASYRNPASGELHYNLGNEYSADTLYPLAVAEYRTAHKLGMDSPQLFNNWALACDDCGYTEEADRVRRLAAR